MKLIYNFEPSQDEISYIITVDISFPVFTMFR